MKKAIVLALAVLVSVPLAFSAIVTNSNQSIQYYRMLARNASTDIDAVFYNPAGLVKLADGFHLSIQNQSIWQDKTVTNGFPFLNTDTYKGTTRVPVFPDIYAVYKTGKLALSFGFGPNAGGGTAKFNTGLPDLEIPFAEAMLPLDLIGAGVNRSMPHTPSPIGWPGPSASAISRPKTPTRVPSPIFPTTSSAARCNRPTTCSPHMVCPVGPPYSSTATWTSPSPGRASRPSWAST
jgi:hypothetical protein